MTLSLGNAPAAIVTYGPTMSCVVWNTRGLGAWGLGLRDVAAEIRHRELGGHILLIVRTRKKQDGLTVPYTFLGAVEHVSHKQENPIQFVWQLRRSMPADFFRQAKVAAG